MLRDVADAVGSTLTLTGAVAIGWGLHRAVWLGDLALGSPAFVLAVGGGAALVAAGWYLEASPSVEADEGEPEAEDAEETEYDERFSPMDADRLADGDGNDE